MLAFLFRGVFLVGVLSWYSTSVWKMIDGYFKNQFQRYLREEYAKNPQMRADVEAYGSSETRNPDLPTVDNLEEVVMICQGDSCSVGNPEDEARSTTSTTEIETLRAGVPIDTVIRDESSERDGKTVPDSCSKVVETANLASDPIPASKGMTVKRSRIIKKPVKRRKTSRRKGEKSGTKGKRGRGSIGGKVRFETIKLTEKDFASTRLRAPMPEDFAEFDDDDDPVDSVGDEPESGISVSELPIVPKIDLSHLRKISPEEFCPVTEDDDEESCDDIKSWP